MIKKFVIYALAFLPLSFAKAQQPAPESINNIALSEQKRFTHKVTFQENQDYASWDLIYQRMNWTVDPKVRFIQGEITSHFRSKSDDLLQIIFDLHSVLTVDSVYYHAEKTDFSHLQNKIYIPLEPPLAENTIDSVTVFYQGIPPKGNNFGSFAQTVHLRDTLAPIIWTLSEPYGAMEWWPCKQSLIDKVDSIDIIVTSPEPYRTASNGILVSETVDDEIRTMHWKHRFPIVTYLVAIAVTNYVDYSDTLQLSDGRPIEIQNFVYPEDLEYAKSATPVTVDIMRLFNNLIGEYPFAAEKYGHAQFGWGGGMEHQTMSFMNNFDFQLVAHELAHQWFGDYITLASWHHIWLNEGFATYLTGLSYENLLDGVWWPRWKNLTVDRITSLPGGSVYVPDTTDVPRIFDGRLSYSKGAYLLHMLRWVLGEEHFFEGLRNYYKDPTLANGFADHNDFVRHMETVGDTTLSEFFDDWYFGEGFPVYRLEYAATGSNTYELNLSQSTSSASVDFFEMPVPVRVYNSSKSDSANFTLIHSQNNQVYIIETDFEIDDIKIDPDRWLISQTSEILKTPTIETSDEIKIFPNPTLNELIIKVPYPQTLLSTEIFTPQGKKVAQIEESNSRISLAGLPSGIYIFRITTSEKRFIKKISKK